jgi:hypothetical protein
MPRRSSTTPPFSTQHAQHGGTRSTHLYSFDAKGLDQVRSHAAMRSLRIVTAVTSLGTSK